MKRILSLILFLIVLATGTWAGDLQPYSFPMTGKWVPSGQSLMSTDEFGFQDVQNMRRDGPAWIGVKGHSKINTTLLSSYPFITNGFQFRKTTPAESHILVVAGDTVAPANSVVYENETAIPTAGDFNASVWYTDTGAGMGAGRFSYAPNGNMVYSNGVVQYIWGGDETRITAFYTGSDSISSTTTAIPDPADYSEKLQNSSTSDTCSLGTVFFIGTNRPVSGFKFYLSSNSAVTATMSATYWGASGWTAVSNASDGTIGTAGKTLSQTGTYSFDSTVSTAQPRYIQGLAIYWYQFVVTSDPDAVLYQVTAISPKQTVKNVWDGAQIKPTKIHRDDYGSATDGDETDTLIDGSSETYVTFEAFGSKENDAVYIGSPVPLQGIQVSIGGTCNKNACTMTVNYWTGAAWSAVSAQYDGTSYSGRAFFNSGVISWSPPGEGTEQKRALYDDSPLYYYKLDPSAGMTENMKVTEMRAIPYGFSVKTYKFSELFQNRLFLLDEVSGKRNKLIYSVSNNPDSWNGTDSGYLYVGDDSTIVAARPVFNIFKSGAYDQLIIGKSNETWRLSGDGPSTWTLARINANVGVVAPLSMVSCEVAEGMEEGVKRQVVIFQGSNGFYVTDGASVIPISDDIRCYFDSNDSRAIPAARLSKTVAWFDPSLGVYKALISSGASATYHNVELEYSITTREWTKIYRADGSGANPLQSGFPVVDTNGISYSYGGNTKGNVYRLENGYTFDSTAIDQYLWTKDVILDNVAPILRKSTVRNFRVVNKDQAGTMTVTHYGDGTATVEGTNNQNTIDSVNLDTAPYNSQSCLLGPFLYHSFKFACSASTTTGMELSGFGLWYEPYTIWR